jgi:hypothetical protein
MPSWPCDLNSEDKDGTPISKSRKINEGKIYKVSRMKSGANASSCKGEYVAATVVHASERKTRFKDVDHEESMGIARREASGTVKGAKSDVRDIVARFSVLFLKWC